MKAATTMFARNDTTKTPSLKIWSSTARTDRKYCIEGGDDGDGQVGLQRERHVGDREELRPARRR